MGEKSFDASRYLVSLKGKDYLEVKWRLLWLRTEHPDAIIQTDLHTLGQDYAVFKASVTIPDGGAATGWGSEEASDFNDFLEKAETKALGRALAALGYGTQFTEDFDFQQDGEQRLVDSPVDRSRTLAARERASAPARTAGPRSLGDQATQAQVNALYSIGRREHGWSDEETDNYARTSYGRPVTELTKREASELIVQLRAVQAAS